MCDGGSCRKAFVLNNEVRAAMLEKVKPSRFDKKTCTTAWETAAMLSRDGRRLRWRHDRKKDDEQAQREFAGSR